MYGVLPGSDQCEPVADAPAIPDLEHMWWQCAESNAELIGSLREDPNAEALHQMTLDDYDKGRMTKPVPVSTIDATQALGIVRAVQSVPLCTLWCAGTPRSSLCGGTGTSQMDHPEYVPSTACRGEHTAAPSAKG